MDPKKLMKQMFDLNKAAVEKTFSTMTLMQDQTEKMFNLWMDQNKLVPEPGKKSMIEWMKACKKSRDEFKAKIDEGYDKMDKYFTVQDK